MARRVPTSIARELRLWAAAARLFTIAHYSIGSMAIISSVIGSLKGLSSGRLKVIVSVSSIVSAMCAGFITLFGLDRTARAYHRAADALRQACVEYEVDATRTELDLLRAYKEAAKLRMSVDR